MNFDGRVHVATCRSSFYVALTMPQPSCLTLQIKLLPFSLLNEYCIIICMTYFQGVLIVLWKILSDEITGIFIAINVLDTITNFGQVCMYSDRL